MRSLRPGVLPLGMSVGSANRLLLIASCTWRRVPWSPRCRGHTTTGRRRNPNPNDDDDDGDGHSEEKDESRVVQRLTQRDHYIRDKLDLLAGHPWPVVSPGNLRKDAKKAGMRVVQEYSAPWIAWGRQTLATRGALGLLRGIAKGMGRLLKKITKRRMDIFRAWADRGYVPRWDSGDRIIRLAYQILLPKWTPFSGVSTFSSGSPTRESRIRFIKYKIIELANEPLPEHLETIRAWRAAKWIAQFIVGPKESPSETDIDDYVSEDLSTTALTRDHYGTYLPLSMWPEEGFAVERYDFLKTMDIPPSNPKWTETESIPPEVMVPRSLHGPTAAAFLKALSPPSFQQIYLLEEWRRKRSVARASHLRSAMTEDDRQKLMKEGHLREVLLRMAERFDQEYERTHPQPAFSIWEGPRREGGWEGTPTDQCSTPWNPPDLHAMTILENTWKDDFVQTLEELMAKEGEEPFRVPVSRVTLSEGTRNELTALFKDNPEFSETLERQHKFIRVAQNSEEAQTRMRLASEETRASPEYFEFMKKIASLLQRDPTLRDYLATVRGVREQTSPVQQTKTPTTPTAPTPTIHGRKNSFEEAEAIVMRAFMLYSGGEGVQDPVTSRKLFVEAACCGHTIAMFNAACMFSSGEGSLDGKPDFKAAVQWYQRCIGPSDSSDILFMHRADAAFNLALLYLNRQVEGRWSQLLGQEFAFCLLDRAAKSEHVPSLHLLFHMCMRGIGHPKSTDLALRYLAQAANNNVTFTGRRSNLYDDTLMNEWYTAWAELMHDSHLVPRTGRVMNMQEYLDWMQSDHCDSAEALYVCALASLEGQLVRHDVPRAIEALQKAASRGHAASLRKLENLANAQGREIYPGLAERYLAGSTDPFDDTIPPVPRNPPSLRPH